MPPTCDVLLAEDSLWFDRKVRIKKLRPDAIIPTKGTERSAGFDFYVPDDVIVPAQTMHRVLLGLVIATPPGHMLLVAPRSSTFKTWGVKLANTVGIVDEDYAGDTDDMCLLLLNPGTEDSFIPKGSRVAQGILVPISSGFEWEEVPEGFTMGSSRGGWGSTGKK